MMEVYKGKLLSVAYKMTRSMADSEDILQDVFLAFAQVNPAQVADAEAYLVKSVMNRSLNWLEKRKQFSYPGIDLPEPLLMERFADMQRYDISYALVVTLQKLNPAERAVFLLRETLDYEYEEIADMLELTAANCRQLLHRAKEKIAAAKTRYTPTAQQRSFLLEAFVTACASGDATKLASLLKADIVLYADGGGKVSAARNPVAGQASCIAFLLGLYEKTGSMYTLEFVTVNGEAGLLLRDKTTGQPDTVISFEIDDTGIGSIFMIRNPDKLHL